MRTEPLGALLMAAWTGIAAAQEPVRVRFAPARGQQVVTITDVTTTTRLFGFPALPDGTRIEETRRLFARQEVVDRVVDRVPAGWRIEVTVDSVRGRTRAGDGAWRDLPASALDGVGAVVLVGDRFNVTGMVSVGARDSDVLRALTAWLGGLGFAFPDGPLDVGATFETGARVPFTAELTADSALPLRETVFGPLTLQLDSLTDRGADTLLHFSFSGSFAPHRIGAAGESQNVQADFAGAFAGRLIWSTGWDAFVSGAAQSRVEARAAITTADGQTDVTVRWETAVVHRVRP